MIFSWCTLNNKIQSSNIMTEHYKLALDNLVPFYLIEDRLKDNFARIEKFIQAQTADNDKKQI